LGRQQLSGKVSVSQLEGLYTVLSVFSLVLRHSGDTCILSQAMKNEKRIKTFHGVNTIISFRYDCYSGKCLKKEYNLETIRGLFCDDLLLQN